MRFALILVAMLFAADSARAMCGCMLRPRPKVGETASAKIINKSSKVILARDDDRTVMTLSNDFEGAPAEFGIVIPVPTAIKREDVKIVEDTVFAALEALTAPRVQEVFEPDPCERRTAGGAPRAMAEELKPATAAPKKMRASDYGVKIESHFFAGEYEIAVLAGKDSTGLIKWLQLFNYDVPDDAARVLESYIKQNMRFFVARVYVKEMGNERRDLRPIQVSYKTPKFMLPIRLGMVNANGPQELLVFALAKNGRVESTNYRTVKMPTGAVLPHFVKDDWSNVYSAMFDEQTKREDMRVVFLEDARNASVDAKTGAFWGTNAFVTRLHFKYVEEKFPEDLVLQSTSDAMPYNIVHTAIRPANSSCPDPGAPQRRAREQQQLANLTGWSMENVMQRVGGVAQPGQPPKDPWWNKLWQE
jgi:hypothetical protein